jgi:phosphate transport system permease protein
MHTTWIFATLAGLSVLAYIAGRRRALAIAGGATGILHSLPTYHGVYVALWCVVPSLLLISLWLSFEPIVANAYLASLLGDSVSGLSAGQRALLLTNVKGAAVGAHAIGELEPSIRAASDTYGLFLSGSRVAMTASVLALSAGGLVWGRRSVSGDLRARNRVESAARILMFAASAIAVLTTIGIVLSLIFEALRFFARVPITEFLFGLKWSPQTALRADQVGASGAFGAIPLFVGTLLITFLAMCVAVPIGLFSAIFMSEYAQPRTRAVAKPLLEILAGIPTVVYGFFAALTVAPVLRSFGADLGFEIASESPLAAGAVMGIMIVPFISSLSDDVMNAVPQTLRDGAYALGATKSEAVRQVVLPAALPGIVGAVLLAVSRAIGETMIVVMAAGMAANLTLNPFEAVTTVTVQIVTLLVGDQEFDSAKTLAAFALGLTLFCITLGLNVIALSVVRRYRERYD